MKSPPDHPSIGAVARVESPNIAPMPAPAAPAAPAALSSRSHPFHLAESSQPRLTVQIWRGHLLLLLAAPRTNSRIHGHA